MFNKIFTYLKKFDWILFSAVILLLCFGLAELYSIALSQDHFDILNFKKQVLFSIVGVLMLFFLAFFDYYNLRSFNNFIYLIGLVLLVSVLLFGSSIRGTKGWFDLGFINIQPVEFVKIIVIIFLARYFASVSVKYNPIKHIVISGLGTFVFVALVLKQPDFGSALILFLAWLTMVAFAGFNKKYILMIVVAFAVCFTVFWFFVFKDYQKERIMTFVNPSANSLGQGYNVTQAMIAVGSGRLTGRGIGFGSQSQLKFLPEAQTDFIFAVISEELGFLGVFLVVAFFVVIIYRILKAAKKANNDFAVYLLLGSGALIFIEMFINIGMNIGIMPVVGLPLPFVSYGGSSLLSLLILVGMVENIVIKAKTSY